jgi:hypothetical protein
VRTAFGIVLGLISAPALAQHVERIEIVEYGVYAAPSANTVAAPGTASGVVHEVPQIKLVEKTQTIPARVGVRFGIEYRIVGSATDNQVNLKRMTIFPGGGLRNPSTGKVVTRDEATEPHAIGDLQYSGYVFDDPWELVPGTWTIELWFEDKRLASQSFTVTPDASQSR